MRYFQGNLRYRNLAVYINCHAIVLWKDDLFISLENKKVFQAENNVTKTSTIKNEAANLQTDQ